MNVIIIGLTSREEKFQRKGCGLGLSSNTLSGGYKRSTRAEQAHTFLFHTKLNS